MCSSDLRSQSGFSGGIGVVTSQSMAATQAPQKRPTMIRRSVFMAFSVLRLNWGSFRRPGVGKLILLHLTGVQQRDLIPGIVQAHRLPSEAKGCGADQPMSHFHGSRALNPLTAPHTFDTPLPSPSQSPSELPAARCPRCTPSRGHDLPEHLSLLHSTVQTTARARGCQDSSDAHRVRASPNRRESGGTYCLTLSLSALPVIGNFTWQVV